MLLIVHEAHFAPRMQQIMQHVEALKDETALEILCVRVLSTNLYFQLRRLVCFNCSYLIHDAETLLSF